MNETINKSLAEVRRALSESSTSLFFQPSMITVAGGNPTAVPGLAAAVANCVAPHDAEPAKMTDVDELMDGLDQYLQTLADSVLNGYDTDPDTATTIVFAAIDDLVKAGLVPDLPEGDASPETLALWVEKAKKADLGMKVSELAFNQSEEIDG